MVGNQTLIDDSVKYGQTSQRRIFEIRKSVSTDYTAWMDDEGSVFPRRQWQGIHRYARWFGSTTSDTGIQSSQTVRDQLEKQAIHSQELISIAHTSRHLMSLITPGDLQYSFLQIPELNLSKHV